MSENRTARETQHQDEENVAQGEVGVCEGAQGAAGLSLIAANKGSKRFHNKRVAHTRLDTLTLSSLRG